MQIYWYSTLNYRNLGVDFSFQTEFYLLDFLSLSIGRKVVSYGVEGGNVGLYHDIRVNPPSSPF
jgi:hypothetical protein